MFLMNGDRNTGSLQREFLAQKWLCRPPHCWEFTLASYPQTFKEYGFFGEIRLLFCISRLIGVPVPLALKDTLVFSADKFRHGGREDKVAKGQSVGRNISVAPLARCGTGQEFFGGKWLCQIVVGSGI